MRSENNSTNKSNHGATFRLKMTSMYLYKLYYCCLFSRFTFNNIIINYDYNIVIQVYLVYIAGINNAGRMTSLCTQLIATHAISLHRLKMAPYAWL